MAKVTVYLFSFYLPFLDKPVKGCRWGTAEAIHRMRGHPIMWTASVVDETVLGRELPGLSDIGFQPYGVQKARGRTLH